MLINITRAAVTAPTVSKAKTSTATSAIPTAKKNSTLAHSAITVYLALSPFPPPNSLN